ncbi:hypothetical protein TNCV_4557831 [Trichonephila clavipes]|nr:hypothetical protein TNCV_4557831 [Trichonephila clavipes]
MPSPIQSIVMLTSPLQTGSTVLSGQWDTQQVCVRIVLLPSNVWQQFFGRSAFPKATRNRICHPLSCGAPVPLADRSDISVFCRRRTSNTTSPCRLLHIPVVLIDFYSRETTL